MTCEECRERAGDTDHLSDLNKTLAQGTKLATQSGWPELHILSLAATFPGSPSFHWAVRTGQVRTQPADRDGAGDSQTEDTEGELTIELTTEVPTLVTSIGQCEETTLL